MNYSVYNAARRALAEAPPQLAGATGRFGLTGDALASGALAGAALSAVLGPTELVKCRVQMQVDPSVTAAVSRIWRTRGAAGFARGLGATLAREVPGNAIFFAAYEGACPDAPRCLTLRGVLCLRALLPATRFSHGLARVRPNPLAALQRASPDGGGGASSALCGGLAGMIYWAVVLPIDTAKTRLQVALPRGCGGTAAGDMGLLGHLRAVHAERGIASGWYAGVGPVMLRGFVANAVQWLAWEQLSKRLHAVA